MTEIRRSLYLSQLTLEEVQRVFLSLQDRLDELEGRRGTPAFFSDINMRSNKITSIRDASANQDAPSYGQIINTEATVDSPGLLPRLSGDANDFLSGDGTWVARQTYTAESITTSTGTPTGTVDNIKEAFDGNTYKIDEVAGIPGFSTVITFNNIEDFDRIIARICYDGSTSHIVGIDLYNFLTSTYNQVTLVPTSSTYFNWFSILGLDSTNYLSNGEVRVRIYHYSNGNNAHDLFIDYVALV